MKWYADPIENEENRNPTYRALAITFFGNLVLAVIKWIAAGFSGSSALFADAYNSISDVLYSLTLVLGMIIAIRPADMTHPQGHGRFEPLVGLVISGSMFWAGWSAISEAIERIKTGPSVIDPGLPVIVLVISGLIKLLMFRLIGSIAKKIRSRALSAAAKDNLMDVITSLAAVLGVFLSGLVHPLCDPIVGILVGLWIFKAAGGTLHENMSYLTGHGATQEELNDLRSEIRSVPGVLDVHQLYAEYVGTKLRLDVHINLDGSTPLEEVHRIETEIEKRLSARNDVDRIYIHAEPPEELG